MQRTITVNVPHNTDRWVDCGVVRDVQVKCRVFDQVITRLSFKPSVFSRPLQGMNGGTIVVYSRWGIVVRGSGVIKCCDNGGELRPRFGLSTPRRGTWTNKRTRCGDPPLCDVTETGSTPVHGSRSEPCAFNPNYMQFPTSIHTPLGAGATVPDEATLFVVLSDATLSANPPSVPLVGNRFSLDFPPILGARQLLLSGTTPFGFSRVVIALRLKRSPEGNVTYSFVDDANAVVTEHTTERDLYRRGHSSPGTDAACGVNGVLCELRYFTETLSDDYFVDVRRSLLEKWTPDSAQ